MSTPAGLTTTFINPPEGATVEKEAAVRKQLEPYQKFLDDPSVCEICVNKPFPNPFFVERHDGSWEKVLDKRTTNETVNFLATAAATYSNQKISRQTPILSSNLFDGSRMQFVITPAAHQNNSFTLRKPSLKTFPLEHFENQGLFKHIGENRVEKEYKDVDDKLRALLKAGEITEFFKQCIYTHKTMVIGGQTRAGKTTFMKSLCTYIPLRERLITIENARELFVPHENVVHLMYPDKGQGEAVDLTASKLLKSCMRMRPDRVLIAELTGEETEDFLQVGLSGHTGSITTMHSDNPTKGFERLADLSRKATNSSEDGEVLVKRVKSNVDIFVQFKINEQNQRYLSHVYMQPN